MIIGATTIPLAGWAVDTRQPERSRTQRLDAIRQLINGYGLSAVELTLDLGIVFPQVFDRDFYAAVANLQQELGFTCTAHLPLLWLDTASLNEPVRRTSVACLQQAVELTQVLEVLTYTLHLWGFTTIQIHTLLQDPVQRKAILSGAMAQAGRSLAELCEIVDPHDLCVENLESPPFEEVWPRIEPYGVSICLDVGHLVWQGGDELAFLAQHGERIREVHLHDAAHVGHGERWRVQDHLALGQGEIAYTAFLNELQHAGYKGAVIIEVNSKVDLEQSLEKVRALL